MDCLDPNTLNAFADGLLSARAAPQGMNSPDLYPEWDPLLPPGSSLALLAELRTER